MAYSFKDISDMDESHLLNTINCGSSHITEQRKDQCRLALTNRWTNVK